LLNAIVPNIKKTSDLVQEIASASAEQTLGVGQISAAITQMNQATQQNAASSEELAATSEEMSAQAQQLQQSMAFFKLSRGTPDRALKTAVKRSTVRRAAAGYRRSAAAVATEIALALRA
jgi:methyl-accepting chemotaxis protein